MTERLYYEDAYLLEFEATVTSAETKEDRYLITLDRSAFYPTSGGQPYDTGTVNGCRVLDVYVDENGEVRHVIGESIAVGTRVLGKIDSERRTDHMQQHAADHMIAGALYERCRATTIGLHIGADVSSIDVQFSDGTTRLDGRVIAEVEDIVNQRIRDNVPIRCWFPEESELRQLPLRKEPTVKEHVRVVAIGDFEMVACGGTHPARTGEIGLVKILDVSPARGKARVTFVAGRRALDDYRVCFEAAHKAADMFTTSILNLEESVRSMKQRLKDAESELKAFKREVMLGNIDAMVERAEILPCGIKLLVEVLDTDRSLLKDAASAAVKKTGVAALLAVKAADGYAVTFARSEDIDLDMGSILRAAGAKGGGKKDFAQGSAAEDILPAAAMQIRSMLAK